MTVNMTLYIDGNSINVPLEKGKTIKELWKVASDKFICYEESIFGNDIIVSEKEETVSISFILEQLTEELKQNTYIIINNNKISLEKIWHMMTILGMEVISLGSIRIKFIGNKYLEVKCGKGDL